MCDSRAYPQSGPSADRHQWLAAKVFVILALTVGAAYVTATKLL